MFDTLARLSATNVDAGAEALAKDGEFQALLDPSGIWMHFKGTADGDLDFACLRREGEVFVPVELTAEQHDVLYRWTQDAVPRLIRRWKRISVAVPGRLLRPEDIN